MPLIETDSKPVEIRAQEVDVPAHEVDIPAREAAIPAHEVDVPAHEVMRRDSDLSDDEQPRKHVTGPQRLAGVLIAVVCVVCVAWYVPKVVAADRGSFTGTVSSSGVSNLNFASAGRVAQVSVQIGQVVKAGQVLATEAAPAAITVTSADKAAIAADQASIAGVRAESAQTAATTLVTAATLATENASLAAAEARLAEDQATLQSDQLKLLETEIIAPSAGTIVAVNGQVGETVSADGIRVYSAQPGSSTAQVPAFSLLPEGPESTVKSGSSQTAVPVITVRTSSVWQVVVLIPESSAAAVKVGHAVTIAVPAAHLSGVRGHIQELSPTPVTTSGGIAYEVLVNVIGHQRATPLSGMAADVQLGS